jgi:intein/homing endonuclease
MPKILDLPADVVQVIQDSMDDLIELVGTDCRLIYPPAWLPCANCWTGDTMISTPYGPTPIKDINPGDVVYTPFGNTKEVVRTYSREHIGELVKIKCYGISLDSEATTEHKVLAIRKLRNHYTQHQWYNSSKILSKDLLEDIAIGDLEPGDAVFVPIRPPVENDLLVVDLGSEIGIVKCDDDLLYFFGWWIAEGCVSKGKYPRTSSFCLRASREVEIANRLNNICRRIFNTEGKLVFRTDADNLLLTIHSARLARLLLRFGHGAANKSVPEWLWNKLSSRQRNVLLEAYYSGDGNLLNDPTTSVYSRRTVVTISRRLAMQVWEHLQDHNLSPTIGYTKAKVGHRQAYRVTWQQDRRQQKSGVRRIEGGILATIKEIEKRVGNVTVYDLEIADEHYYIANGVGVHNCVYDPIGEKSSNTWITGGPIPFDAGAICPMCNGGGKLAVENTFVVTMIVRINPSKWWVKPPFGVQIPDGMIQTKGYYTDAPRILQSRKMVLQTATEGILRQKYELAGEPIDASNLVQGRYIVCLWNRVP